MSEPYKVPTAALAREKAKAILYSSITSATQPDKKRAAEAKAALIMSNLYR